MKRVSAISLSLLATAVAVRVGLIFRYRFDSDEPQHMHVAWGWAHGLAQYRDVFDNHMPLFHLLSSPLFAATGDDPRLLFAARLSMLPRFLISLVLVWLGVIAVAVRDLGPARKAALGGLLLGGAFGVSMNSSVLVLVLASATLATLLLTMRRAPIPSARLLAKCALIAAAATAIIPLLIAGGFAAAGLWKWFVYGVFEHNRFPFERVWK